jgi:hypothetical protein
MSYAYSQSEYGDRYTDNGHVRGRCSVCGDTKQHRQEKNRRHFRAWYYRVFEKLDIFRGNDEYRGMICRKCLKDGRIAETSKSHPNQLEED